ncbi:UDP-glucose 4-epimerase GalE [Nocardiopsis terrae]|uniref:UDP-glucose 4-epimerase n=1 Tax=Nocardiopsis terrae TaxID=372655 RepID=A0ABR9HN42_9ACTN|nr:UDP-glucose 4-epimerase GalE [Nocardiopsis terrae]MBE1460378.1 UDP-glucose 4-epimerase [Nocardiopsis terrae]GHC71135.1 UDP-glucose 4-epimerase GalE [Nocardiopsis terrae]
MKLLVTGGAGYIGSVVTALLLEAGHGVTVLDSLSTGHRDAVPPGAALVEGDVHGAADVLDPSFDAVLHFAAKSLVGESVQDPGPYWANNVGGTLALLEAMRSHGVNRLVFSSTAATYGDPLSEAPLRESDPAVPANPYGASKLAVDHLLSGWAQAHGLGAVSLRYFNVAGAHLGFGERHDPETHLVPNLLRVAAGRAPHASVLGTDYPTGDGTAVRDYLHVADLAEAHLRALERAEPGSHRVYNLGSGGGYSVREVLAAVRRVTGHPVPAVDGPRRAGDPAVLVAANALARRELGWKPVRTLDQTVADAWAFARGREADA